MENTDEYHYEMYQLGLVTWREVLFASVKTNLVDVALKLIESERNGQIINTNLVGIVVQICGKRPFALINSLLATNLLVQFNLI